MLTLSRPTPDWRRDVDSRTPHPSTRVMPVAKFALREPVSISVKRDNHVATQDGHIIGRCWLRDDGGRWVYDVHSDGAFLLNQAETDIKARAGELFGSVLVGDDAS